MEIDEVLVKENPGVCRCCLSEGCYKDLASEYAWMGDTEVYADMLLDCFDISISQHSDGPNGPNRLICEVCITRLRDACNFKKQVVESEKKFVDMLGRGEFKSSDMVTTLKIEPANDDGPDADVEYLDDMDFDDDSEEEDVPLKHLASTSHAEDVKPKKPRKKAAVVKTEKTIKKEKKKTATKPKNVTLKSQTDIEKKEALTKKMLIKRRNVEYILQYSNVTPFLWYKGKYRCFYCTEPTKDPASLREHTTKEHASANLELVIYDRMTYNSNKDAAVKIDVKDLACKLCSTPLSGVDELSHHLIIAHDAEYDTNITNCVLPFLLDKTSPSCPTCNTTFGFFEYLLRHANKYHLSHNYMCDICGTSFQGENHMKMHHRYYHKEGGYNCEYCDVTCANLCKLGLHQKNVHLVKLSRCQYCSETFKSRYLKQMHLANIHGVEELKIKCPYCVKVFPQPSIMSRHMRRVHLREKNVECEVCNEKFFQSYDLKLHMMKHNGEKPLVCQTCGKKFAKKSNLTTHELVHSEKTFNCDLCSASFTRSNKLQAHKQERHPDFNTIKDNIQYVYQVIDGQVLESEVLNMNTEELKCSVCQTVFATESDLDNHVLLHIEPNRYLCEICKDTFLDPDSLREHIGNSHPEYRIVDDVQYSYEVTEDDKV